MVASPYSLPFQTQTTLCHVDLTIYTQLSTVHPNYALCVESFYTQYHIFSMSKPLQGTAIITGGNGTLGSEIAIAIAKTQPYVHLLLLARDIRSDSVKDLLQKIRLIGPRSVEVAKVNLASFNSVVSFCQNTVERVRTKEIPPVMLLINSAVMASYVTDPVTPDGYDPVYQINCIAPFLLTVSLLEAFRAGNGTPDGGARVINIGCSAISCGSLDYFDDSPDNPPKPPGTPLSAKEGNARLGSSKLIMSAAMYALRRSLVLVGLWVAMRL